MSFDRALPTPTLLRYEGPHALFSTATNLLDHKVIKDGTMAKRTVAHALHPADAGCRSDELRFNWRILQDQLQSERPKGPKGQSEPLLMPNEFRPGRILDTEGQRMLHRSAMLSSIDNPMKSAPQDGAEQFSLCQPNTKIPRPRNG